jgi:hypothetical protein
VHACWILQQLGGASTCGNCLSLSLSLSHFSPCFLILRCST